MRRVKQGRGRACPAGGEHRRDRDRDLEAVLFCPVIDESRGDKDRGKDGEKARKRERGWGEQRGAIEVGRGQRRGFLPLVLKRSRV